MSEREIIIYIYVMSTGNLLPGAPRALTVPQNHQQFLLEVIVATSIQVIVSVELFFCVKSGSKIQRNLKMTEPLAKDSVPPLQCSNVSSNPCNQSPLPPFAKGGPRGILRREDTAETPG
jgi:hypothetical protein